MWVVMQLQRWEDYGTNLGRLTVEGPGFGFLPVFDSKEEAEREFPSSPIVQLRAAEKK